MSEVPLCGHLVHGVGLGFHVRNLEAHRVEP